MKLNLLHIIFQALLTLTLFSFWAAFALLIVNQFFYKDLPGYTIGRICIWELVAIIIAAIISQWMIKKWGTIQLEQVEGQTKLTLHPNYGIYFLVYFICAIVIGIWQFWLFSQQF